IEASCCVARKIFLSAASASSRARTLDSRPTTNGVIMNGKMTTSRIGIMGSLRDSNLSLIWDTEILWVRDLRRDHAAAFIISGATSRQQQESGARISGPLLT